MSNDGNDDKRNNRRTFLTGVTTVLFAAGGIGLAIPYARAWNPSARAKAAGTPISVDLSQIPEGALLIEEWRGRPIYILRRTAEMLESTIGLEDKLRDPDSEENQQPDYAQNANRSIQPEILVVEGVCTHLGCAPKFRGKNTDAGFSGFFCPCHGSKFDFSGRVYKGVPAPTNLKVPPYYYLNTSTLVIGTGKERQSL